MKKLKGKSFFLVMILAAVFAFACVREVRYSPAEIKKYPPEVQNRIRQGEVSLGMTPEQVRYSWGSPTEVNVLKPAEGGKMREEWVYKNIFSTMTLVFTEGRLTEIISSGVGGRKYEKPESPRD